MTNEKPNEVRSTTVAITLNAKNLGIDAFVKLEQTSEFSELISDVDALVKREEMSALLLEQILALVDDASEVVKSKLNERGLTTFAPSTGFQAPALAPAYSSAPAGTGAGAIRAVANGAQTNGDWRVAVDAFDSAKQVRYLSTNSVSSDELKSQAHAWLASQGFTNDVFDIWDERRDAENGKPISSVCNIKIKEAYRTQAPAELVFTDRGGVKAIARAKFNSDGSLFFHWANKAVDAAIKYGAFSALQA